MHVLTSIPTLPPQTDMDKIRLHTELYDLVKNKEYFVLTTNVDHQFYKAGFDEKRIFATQGDYGKIQCQKACHSKTYDAKDLFRKMDKARRDCLIPSELVPNYKTSSPSPSFQKGNV